TAIARRGIGLIERPCPPGHVCSGFPPHYHGVHEAAIVVGGRVKMVIGSDEIELGPGDSVTYAADVEHSAYNRGDSPARVIYVVDSTHARRAGASPAPRHGEE